MKKNIYNSFKAIFSPKKETLTQEQINYILSGFSDSLLRDYQIIYSPVYIQMTLDKKRTNFYSKNLESKVEDKQLRFIERLRENFKRNMNQIKIDSLRNINRINSTIIETYKEGLDNIKNISIKERNDGSVIYRFT
jgi:flagellar motor switch protein FliM